MKWIFLKYMIIYGVLLLCFVQENESNFDQPIETNFDLNQNAHQITVIGSIYSPKNIQNVRITIEVFGDDRSFIFNLFDITYNLPANKSITLREINNGHDIAFPLEYLYGEYIVMMKISGGIPSMGTISIEKDFQTELTLLRESIPIDTPNLDLQIHQHQFYLPCCSSKVAEDLNDYFEFDWTEEQINRAAEKIENDIYPKYINGFSDLNKFFNDLNILLELNLEQKQIDELVYALENGLFSPRADTPIPQISDEIIKQMAKYPSDSSAPFLTGKNVIARIYVNDPLNIWNSNDRDTAWQQIITTTNQIQAWAPHSANVSFIHVSFMATLDFIPDYSFNDPENYWMKDVVNGVDTREHTACLSYTQIGLNTMRRRSSLTRMMRPGIFWLFVSSSTLRVLTQLTS